MPYQAHDNPLTRGALTSASAPRVQGLRPRRDRHQTRAGAVGQGPVLLHHRPVAPTSPAEQSSSSLMQLSVQIRMVASSHAPSQSAWKVEAGVIWVTLPPMFIASLEIDHDETEPG